jgi:hypothetical protein
MRPTWLLHQHKGVIVRDIPLREIRAVFNDETIRVYQAYSNTIADSAIAAGTFVSPPFKMDRMTWIKPSFLWMMYRSGWATKPGQERILAIDITREGFEWALSHSCLSHYDPKVYKSREAWLAIKAKSPVRIQWDPERDINLEKLEHRSIQIGLSGDAVYCYTKEWIKSITDLTPTIRKLKQYNLPTEENYSLASHLQETLGITAHAD